MSGLSKRLYNLQRNWLLCVYCSYKSRQHNQLNSHLETNHLCLHCSNYITDLSKHVCNQDGYGQSNFHNENILFVKAKSAHKGTIEKYSYKPPQKITLVATLIDIVDDALTSLLQQLLSFHKRYKCKLEIYFLLIDDISKVTKKVLLSAYFEVILNADDVFPFITQSMNEIIEKLNNFNQDSSSWTVDHILSIDVTVAAYIPIRLGKRIKSLRSKNLKGRRGVLYLTNTGDECFKYAVIACLFHKNPLLVKNRKYKNLENEKNYESGFEYLNFKGISFPITFPGIDLFEKLNNISVNIMTHDNGNLAPVRLTKMYSTEHVDLYMEMNSNEAIYHLIPIIDFSKFVKEKIPHFYCPSCLSKFLTKSKMQEHHKYCISLGSQVITFPTKDFISCSYGQNTLPQPYLVFYDFECYLKPKQSCEQHQNYNSSFKSDLSFLDYESIHVPIAYGMAVIGPSGLMHYHSYCGEDVLEHFINVSLGIADVLLKYMKVNRRKSLSVEERKFFDAANTCCICEKEFTQINPKVYHHNHVTGLPYKGGNACQRCNLAAKFKQCIPFIAHNATGYDSHLLMESLKHFSPSSVKVIPKNSEKFMGMVLEKKIKFIDSMQFLNSSLDSLVETLKKDKVVFEILHKGFEDVKEPYKLSLLEKKGVFCYEYFSNIDILKETSLPPIEKFYSQLKQEDITAEEYKFAQTIWKEFKCKTFKDYLMLYLKCDVLLLSQAMVHYRENIMKTHVLEPFGYWSLPGYSWDCMLHNTKAKLEIIKDVDMLQMIEKNIRGGVVTVTKRLETANNELVGNYNPSLPRKYIQYADLNQLYGYCLSSYLPVSGFEWLTEDEIKHFDIGNLPEDSGVGWIIEADVFYSEDLAKLTSDLPLMPEARKLLYEEMSDYQKFYMKLNKRDIKNALGCKKLILTVKSKEKYTSYYKTLKYWMFLGMKVTKIHRVIRFHESPFMKKYIDMNVNIRVNAISEAIKKAAKAAINVCYGKSLQKYRDSTDTHICTTKVDCERLVAKPNFDSITFYGDNLTMIQLRKTKVVADKCQIVGFTVLELSKKRLFECWYGSQSRGPEYMIGIKNMFWGQCTLLYTDTDSIIFSYTDHANDYLMKMQKLNHMYDFSNLDSNMALYDASKKGKPGILKVEAFYIKEFVGIKPKVYSLLKYVDPSQMKDCPEEKIMSLMHESRCKGVPFASMKNKRHEFYKNSLFSGDIERVKVNYIRSEKHALYGKSGYKIALNALDTKRYQLDNIHSLPFGHPDIPVNTEKDAVEI